MEERSVEEQSVEEELEGRAEKEEGGAATETRRAGR